MSQSSFNTALAEEFAKNHPDLVQEETARLIHAQGIRRIEELIRG